MRAAKISACIIVILFLLPGGTLIVSMGNDSVATSVEAELNYDFGIYLNGKFDPLKGERGNIPAELRLVEPNGYYVLQVKGPVLQEWQDELKSKGVINYGYIPNFAYLVYMNDCVYNEVTKLPYVRCVVNYEPGYKIDTKLLDEQGRAKLNVLLFDMPDIDFSAQFSHNGARLGRLVDSSDTQSELSPPKTSAVGKNDGIMNKLISIDSVPISIRNLYLKDTLFGKPDFNDMITGDEVFAHTKDIMERYKKFEFAQRIEQLGGKVVEWIEDNYVNVELDSVQIKSLLFMPEINSVSKWMPKRTCMDLISSSSFVYFDYVQPYDGGVDTFDGSKWAARFGKTKIIGAVQDDGIDVNHPDLDDPDIPGYQSRCIFTYGTVTPNDHGTACYLIIFGYPYGALPRGYGGFINWNTADSTAADQVLAQGGVFISHSYGATEHTGYYSTISKSIDDVLYARPKMTFTWAGGCSTPDMLMEEATAKNIISVGGVLQGTSQTTTADDTWLTSYTGTSATADGRAKPDLASYSDKVTVCDGPPYYPYGVDGFGGTSACAPVIAGAAGVVYEMFVEDYFSTGEGVIPYAATVKAMLIANAEQWTNFASVPRKAQGWGYPNMQNIYDRCQYVSDGEFTLSTGETKLINDIPSSTVDPFKVTLVWSDPSPAAPPGSGPCLVNDLNLRVVEKSTGTVYYGNMGLLNSTESASGTGTNPWSGGSNPDQNRDDLNNVENVFIQNPTGIYDIYVDGYNVPTGTQQFSVVVSGLAHYIPGVRFDRTPPLYNYGDRINVTLVDASLNTNPTAIDTGTVKVNSTKDTTGFTMTLPETGVSTNTFFAQLYCSKDLPEGVNTGLSYLSRNIIAVNEVDTIQVSYHDTAPVDVWRNKTAKYDSLPPKISNVRVSEIRHADFTVGFETDELASAYLYLALKRNQSKSPRDDKTVLYSYEDYYLNSYDLATLDDIRNHEAEFLPLRINGSTTKHKIWSYGYPPNSTVYFYVSAEDEFGNIAYDNNGGDYYKVQTVDQPFKILIVDDDTVSCYTLFGYGQGADSAASSLMHAGYYFTVKSTNETGELVMNDTFGGYNWSEQWTKKTFQDYWDGFLWDVKTNSAPNILIYDHGLTNAHYSYNGGTPSRLRAHNFVFDLYGLADYGYAESEVEFPGCIYTANERAKISEFIDNGGRVAFYGSAVAEDYLGIVTPNNEGTTGANLPTAFLNNYMHATIANIGGDLNSTSGTAGVAEEFDVTMGGYTYGIDIDINDDDYSYVGFEGQSGAKVAKTTEVYNGSVMNIAATSGDVIGVYTGGIAEYRWGKNQKGDYPANNATYRYMAVSYEGGTPIRKTYYSSAGMISWNYYMTGVDNDIVTEKFYPDEWYDRLIRWFASGKLQRIRGNVTYGGNPLDNATITAYLPSDWTKPVGATYSNTTGAYEMRIAPGTYELVCWKPGFMNATLVSRSVTLGCDLTEQNFTLTTGVGNITGQVKVADFRWGPTRVSGVRVIAVGTNTVKETQTDVMGYYGLYNLPTGTYTVTADTLDYLNATTTYVATNSSSQSGVSVSQDVTTTNVNFLLKTGAISGRVYDASTGKALKNTFVYAVKNGTPLDVWNTLSDMPQYSVSYDFTDDDGTYYLSMLGPYPHDVRASADGRKAVAEWNESINEYSANISMPYGYSNNTQFNKAVVLGNEMQCVDFAMDSNLGTIKGVVTNASSSAVISGAQVQIELTDPAYMQGFYDTIVATYTGIDGSYSVRVPAGTYKVTASNAGYKTLEQTGKIVSVGGTTTVDASLTPGGTKVLLIFEWNASKTQASGGVLYQWNAMIVNATRATGYDFATWNMSWNDGSVMYIDDGAPTYSVMSAYDVVLYYSLGNIYPEKTFPGAHDAAIQQYLNGGGSFAMFAHEWIYSAVGSTPLMTNGFFLSSFTDDGASDATGVIGVESDPISADWGDHPKNLTSEHGYEDRIHGDVDFFYKYPLANPPVPVATRSNTTNRTWKSLWFGFCITDFTSTPKIDDGDFRILIKNIIDWLAVKPAYAPILSGAGMNKTSGNSSDTFRYFINWTDMDNNAPVDLILTINGKYNYNVTALGGQVDPTDTNYADGKGYYIDVTGLSQGPHTFNFSGSDDKFDAVGDTGVHEGPKIEDTEPPMIEYLPIMGINPNRPVINATVTDNVKVDSVVLYYDNTGSGIFSPVYMVKSENQLNPSEYFAVAGDMSVGEYQVITIDYPDEGQTLSGIVNITGIVVLLSGGGLSYYIYATDGTNSVETGVYSIGVSKNAKDDLEVFIKIDDSSWQLANGTTSWSFVWDTTTVENGGHTIYARAYDGINYSEIDSVNVYVNNPGPIMDVTPSSIDLSIPQGDSDTVTITIRETSGSMDLKNVYLAIPPEIIWIPEEEPIDPSWFTFYPNYFTVPAGGEVNVTCSITIPEYVPACCSWLWDYVGHIEITTSNNGNMNVSVAIYVVDETPPSSAVNYISPYWQTTLPFTITATASDDVTGSGVDSVTLWYRYSADNLNWSNWTAFEIDTLEPWSWSFTALYGNGYYEFYSIAMDWQGNPEDAPSVADAICGVNVTIPDTEKPQISNVEAIPNVQETCGYVNITCTVTDNVAVDEVWVNITNPLGFPSLNITMTKISGMNNYYYDATYLQLGVYSYYIWANDTSGNQNKSTVYQFTIADSISPEISSVQASPDPQIQNGFVNITCSVADEVAVNVVKISITGPTGFIPLNITPIRVAGTANYYYNTTYTLLGTYYYYIWANDTSNNQNISDINTFTIQDTTKPEIFDVHAILFPVVNISTRHIIYWKVIITCKVTDNFGVSVVKVNITGPIGFTPINATMTTKTPPSPPELYYYEVICFDADIYSFYIWANDTSGNGNESTIHYFTIQDTTEPEITNAQACPSVQAQNGWVNISCTVTDNVEVNIVKLNISGPIDFTPLNITMTRIAGTHNYYRNTTYSTAGTYTYYIWANDTSNNGNKSAEYQFTITLQITTTVEIIDNKTINATYSGTGSVNITRATATPTLPENMRGIVFVKVTKTGDIGYVNITIKYNDSDVAGIDESKLRMYYWNETENKWKLCDNTGVDITNNIIWANVTHFTIFAPMAEKQIPRIVEPSAEIYRNIYPLFVLASIAIAVICLTLIIERKNKKKYRQ